MKRGLLIIMLAMAAASSGVMEWLLRARDSMFARAAAMWPHMATHCGR